MIAYLQKKGYNNWIAIPLGLVLDLFIGIIITDAISSFLYKG